MEAGAFTTLKFDKGTLDTLLVTLDKPELFKALRASLSKEDFVMVMDALAGQTLKFPKRDILVKKYTYILIYEYCKKHYFTDESFTKAAKIFEKKPAAVRRIVERLDHLLGDSL